jgi:hypothetical protein
VDRVEVEGGSTTAAGGTRISGGISTRSRSSSASAPGTGFFFRLYCLEQQIICILCVGYTVELILKKKRYCLATLKKESSRGWDVGARGRGRGIGEGAGD